MGDLFHLDLFFLKINFPESVCPVVRPEFMQFVKTPFVYTMFKSDRKFMGPLPETFQLTVSLMTACRLCQTLSMENESDLRSFPWALSYKGVCNMGRIFILFCFCSFNYTCFLYE